MGCGKLASLASAGIDKNLAHRAREPWTAHQRHTPPLICGLSKPGSHHELGHASGWSPVRNPSSGHMWCLCGVPGHMPASCKCSTASRAVTSGPRKMEPRPFPWPEPISFAIQNKLRISTLVSAGASAPRPRNRRRQYHEIVRRMEPLAACPLLRQTTLHVSS